MGQPDIPHQQQKVFQLIESTKAPFLPTLQSRQSNSTTAKIKSIHPDAKLPHRATEGAIGYDIYATESVLIPAHSIQPIPTGLTVELPQGTYLRIAERSSWALKNNISVGGGVVDPDYRGEIKVLLRNNLSKTFSVNKGDKISQVIFEKASTPLIELADDLSPTSRGSGGFGSTNTPKPSKVMSFTLSNNDLFILKKQRNKQYAARRVPRPLLPTLNNEPASTIDVHALDPDESTPESAAFDMTPILRIDSNKNADSGTNGNTIPSPPSETYVNASTPASVSMSRQVFMKSIGFTKVAELEKYIKSLKAHQLTIQQDKSEKLDLGETSTMNKKRANKNKSELPANYSDIWHCDNRVWPL